MNKLFQVLSRNEERYSAMGKQKTINKWEKEKMKLFTPLDFRILQGPGIRKKQIALSERKDESYKYIFANLGRAIRMKWLCQK